MDWHRLAARTVQAATVVLVFFVAVSSLLIAGCSASSSSAGPAPTPTPSGTTAVEVDMGDAPADWMLAFSMNITSMSLTGPGGSTTAVSSSTPMEMMHLMATMQPLTMISAPQGTYTGANIAIGSATAAYIDPSTRQFMQKTIEGPISASVPFASAMNVGSTPMAIGFDLDLAHSVTLDTSGNLKMNPVFHVTSGAQGSGNPSDFTCGGIQQMMGTVSAVSGSSFTMTSMQAARSFAFSMNSSTVFQGGTMASMAKGMMVMVSAALQPDGSLMATNVNMLASGGAMGGGVITSTTGQPVTSLSVVMQSGDGMGMMSSYFASPVSISLTSNTTYSIGNGVIDLSGLGFTPVFDASHIYTGQSVMPVSSGGMMSGGMGGMMGGGSSATMTASALYLMPQGLSGTVSQQITNGTVSNFSLTLPSDSAFKSLTGATSITVYQQTGTAVTGSPIQGGSTIHAFGLLFFDAGEWKMVAARISPA